MPVEMFLLCGGECGPDGASKMSVVVLVMSAGRRASELSAVVVVANESRMCLHQHQRYQHLTSTADLVALHIG
jgi:hypothetical protein